MKIAFVFPGQGSQAVGMGKDLAENFAVARQVFEEVDDALGQKLATLMFQGPDDQLLLTENAQPALMACSMAVVRVLESEGKKSLAELASFVAGHSLGEYSALCAVGAFGLADTAKLLKLRGQSMQKAVPVGVGAMAAVLGMEAEEVEAIAAAAQQQTGKVCSLANDNAPGQIVLSGAKEAIEAALVLVKEKGKKAMPLPVSAPFHCALMAPAAEAMAEALAKVTIAPPSLPVVANVTAQPTSNPNEIRQLLVQQIPGRVRWRESVLNLKAQGVVQAYELGAGKVLAGLIKRIDKEIATSSVGTASEIEATLKSLGA